MTWCNCSNFKAECPIKTIIDDLFSIKYLLKNSTGKNKINKDGYNENLEKTKISKKIVKPMLASKFKYDDLNKKGKGTRIILPCYGQPKLDGLRCLSNNNGSKLTLESRCLKEFNNLDHIKKDLLIESMRSSSNTLKGVCNNLICLSFANLV